MQIHFSVSLLYMEALIIFNLSIRCFLLFLIMTCFHPLCGKVIRKASPGSKAIIKIYKRENLDPLLLVSDNPFIDYIPIPCGRCNGCRIDKARDWAVRLMCEAQYSSNSFFLTLTYDDDHFDSISLSKEDFRSFIKDLRNYYYYKLGCDNIRYFGCGEYGSAQGRKHLHILLFNLPIPDLKVYKVSNGIIYYSSDIISSIWEKGFVVIGEVTPESCQYVARYTLKKQYIKKAHEELQPPFLLMSTNPGIGFQYWFDHKDEIFENWSIFYNHKEASVPKYFKELYKNDSKYCNLIYTKLADLSDKAFDSQFRKMCISDGMTYRDLLDSESIYLDSIEKNKRGVL